MASKVFFIDLRASFKENLLTKLGNLLDAAGLDAVVGPRDLVAVKVHFGETGNTAYIRPVFLRRIVEAVKASGAAPFLTDANTLYAGTRGDAVNHLNTAVRNGFAYSVVEAPVVIADGLRGKSEVRVPIEGRNFKHVYIGSEIHAADALIAVAHFKGHELSGFGGTIKNVGMGCASRKGKLAQHSSVTPRIKRKKCIGCGECVAHCSQGALRLEQDKAVIDPERCIGCAECILVCPNEAVGIEWNRSVPVFLENMVEYTLGVLQNKRGRALFVNFITDVSPACDCLPFNDAPIVHDIGILASGDPVAIDQAAVDLVNREAGLPGTRLTTHTEAGADKFGAIYPNVDWVHQLEYAATVGLGNRSYDLVKV